MNILQFQLTSEISTCCIDRGITLTTPTIDKEDNYTLQFHTFLDRCTLALSLPFAARRLFDKQGKELKALNYLKDDEVSGLP